MTAPVHADAGPTELAAAKRAGRFSRTLEGRVLAAVIQAGDHGLTAKEAREVLGLPVERHYSVAPRLSALKRRDLVTPSGQSRDHFQAYVATPAGRASVGLTFDEEMRALSAAGVPNLDNVTDPDVIGAYGLEPDACRACMGSGITDDGDRLCPECTGRGQS